MGKNKIITSQGNVQFINSKGKTINMHPMHCYAVYENDTVSFLFIYMKEYSGQAFFASQFEDLEVNGESYDSLDELKDAINYAFAKAGAQARTEIVEELPEDPFTNTIYLIKKEHGEGYDEYIWNEDEGWQLIGDTDIEFERYIKIDDFNPYSAATKDYIDAVSGETVANHNDIVALSGAVDTEIANREAADAVISGAVDTLSSDLASEVSRAQNAEQTLQNNINTANARIDAEQIARANADNAISGAVDSVVSDLASEVSRATAKENEIDSKVDGEISDREAADTAISGAVDSLSANLSLEVQRAQNAESALNSKVNALSGEVETMGDEAIVDAAYVSSSTTIDFYNADGAVVAQVDATDFIKDGMIEDVRIENGYLIIDFNTESGIQDISIPLTDIFNPDNYYDKTATDALLADKADLSALTEDERVWGEALNDLNSRVDTISGDVADKVDTSDFEIYSGAVETALGNKFDASGITAYSTSQEVTAEIEAATSGKAENSDLVALSGDVATLSGNAITSGDVQNQIDAAVSGKQDTLIAGENITIVDNVISAEGGGGKAVFAGTNISITTGETADTINCTLPISAGTGEGSIIGGFSGNTASGKYSIALGGRYEYLGDYNYCTATNKGSVSFGGQATGQGAFTCGESTKASGRNAAAIGCYIGEASGVESFITGRNNKAKGFTTFVSGYENTGENDYEFVVGYLAKSNKASTTFGNSGNTLFSVGNGTSTSARHNAFEIRQNGDIYISSGGTDIKLQDHLGGGGSSYTAGDGIDITNDVISVTGKADTSAVTEVSDALTAHTADTTVHTTAAEKTSWNDAVTNASNAVTALGGLSLVKLTSAEYESLTNKDSNTLYIISD